MNLCNNLLYKLGQMVDAVWPGLFILLDVFLKLCYYVVRKIHRKGFFILNIFPRDESLMEAQAYMHIAGYPDFTNRELRDLRRVMHGYMPVDSYVYNIKSKYLNVHSDAGRNKMPSAIPENLINTRDPAILQVFKRKIYPARLIWEFRFGPQVRFSAEDFIDLNIRLCNSIYSNAGELRDGLSFNKLESIMASHCHALKSCGQDVYSMCDEFESLLCELLCLNAFEHGNLFTCMSFLAKIAYFWGRVCRFDDSGMPSYLRFKFSDRQIVCNGSVQVA